MSRSRFTIKFAVIFLILGISVLYILLTDPFGPKKAEAKTLPKESEIKLMWATDIHYLSPSLLHKDSSLHDALESGDGKMSHYSKEITEAFVSEVIKKQPDFVILSGDLTFNGEKASHKDMVHLLEPIKEAGIPVLILPGNHDINQPDAYEFTAEGPEFTETLTEKQFWKMYSPFGATNAVSKDPNSLSYTYQMAEDVQFIFLDTSMYEKENVAEDGRLKEATVTWLEGQLKKARETDMRVYTVSHHNLLTHNPRLVSGYVIENSEEVVALLENYNVKANFSGHMHAQHISQNKNNGITDIAQNAMTVNPCYFGEITITSKHAISYEAKQVDLASWAKEKEISDQNLLHFHTYSNDFMNQCTNIQTYGNLVSYDMSMEDRAKMSKVAQTLNNDYFAGLPTKITKESSAYRLWLTHCEDNFFTKYLTLILEENKNSTKVYIP